MPWPRRGRKLADRAPSPKSNDEDPQTRAVFVQRYRSLTLELHTQNRLDILWIIGINATGSQQHLLKRISRSINNRQEELEYVSGLVGSECFYQQVERQGPTVTKPWWILAFGSRDEDSLLCMDELCFQTRRKGIRDVSLSALFLTTDGCAVSPVLRSQVRAAVSS